MEQLMSKKIKPPAAVPEWLEQCYLNWQQSQGGRRTLTAFAEHIGVRQSVLSNWMTAKRVPRGKSIDLLATRLGPEIYNLMGRVRPDPLYHRLVKILDEVQPEDREELVKMVEQFAATRRHKARDSNKN
jgi:transcriptional regulator with XRE-family HTH domain